MMGPKMRALYVALREEVLRCDQAERERDNLVNDLHEERCRYKTARADSDRANYEVDRLRSLMAAVQNELVVGLRESDAELLQRLSTVSLLLAAREDGCRKWPRDILPAITREVVES